MELQKPREMFSTYEIRRPNGGGSYVNGRWQPPTGYTVVLIQASVQPLNPEEMHYLPEGVKTTDAVKVYTDAELYIMDERTQTPADVIVVDGEEYEIHRIFHQRLSDLAHYKAIAVRKERQ